MHAHRSNQAARSEEQVGAINGTARRANYILQAREGGRLRSGTGQGLGCETSFIQSQDRGRSPIWSGYPRQKLSSPGTTEVRELVQAAWKANPSPVYKIGQTGCFAVFEARPLSLDLNGGHEGLFRGGGAEG